MFKPALPSCLSASRPFRHLDEIDSDTGSDLSVNSARTVVTAPPSLSLLRRLSGAVSEMFHPLLHRPTGQATENMAFATVFETAQSPFISAGSRPAAIGFQWYCELVDNISLINDSNPGSSPTAAVLADAITLRLCRAALALPAPLHGVATATRVLLGPDWAAAVATGRLNISDLLAVLRRCGEVQHAARAELRRRLCDSFQVATGQLAQSHDGVGHLYLSGEPAIRKVIAASELAELQAGQPSMAAFERRLMRFLDTAAANGDNSEVGSLAQRLVHYMKPKRAEIPAESASLAGRVQPATDALTTARGTERLLAARLHEAALRVDSYLGVRAALDMCPDERCCIGEELEPMTHAKMRDRLFGPLMLAALNPEELNARLAELDTAGLLGFVVPALSSHPETARKIQHWLRQTLRPMHDTGLVTDRQRRVVISRVRAALRLREPRTVRSGTV